MDLKLKHTYNFNTLAPAILGERYKLMKVKAILDANEAVKYADISTLHTTLKPVITGLPEHVNDLTFVLFQNTDGEESIYAVEYLDTTTLEEVSAVNVRVEVMDITTADLNVIKTKLLELGYSNLKLTTFE